MGRNSRALALLLVMGAAAAVFLWWGSVEVAPTNDVASRNGEPEATWIEPAAVEAGMDASVARALAPEEPAEQNTEAEVFDEILSARLDELREELAVAESIGATDRVDELRSQIARLASEAAEVRQALTGE